MHHHQADPIRALMTCLVALVFLVFGRPAPAQRFWPPAALTAQDFRQILSASRLHSTSMRVPQAKPPWKPTWRILVAHPEIRMNRFWNVR